MNFGLLMTFLLIDKGRSQFGLGSKEPSLKVATLCRFFTLASSSGPRGPNSLPWCC